MLPNHVSRVMIQLILLIIVITLLSLYSISTEAESAIKVSIQDKLISIANITAAHINGDTFSQIHSGDETTPLFIELRNYLQRTKFSANNINSIYTMRRNGSNVEFVVDADYGNNSDTPGIGVIYQVEEVYKNAEPEIIKGFQMPVADEEFTTDKWGTTLSGFSPIKDLNGNVVGMVGIDMDSSDVIAELNKLNLFLYFLGSLIILSSIVGIIFIEGRKEETDRVIRENVEKYQYLFENAGDSIFILEAGSEDEGKILDANQAASATHGYPKEDLIGMNISQITVSGEGTHVHDQISRILLGERIHTEELHYSRDRSVFPVEISAGLVDTGRETYIFEIVRDITERKKTEERIEESEKRLRFALESIGASEWELNRYDGTVVRSSHHDSLFGYEPNLPEWTYAIFLSHVFPDDRQRIDETIQSSLDKGQKFSDECRILKDDGVVSWIRVSGQPLPGTRGNHERVVGLSYDITEQKQMEADIRQSLQEKETLLHEIHHRVKNNMQIISSLISMQMRTIPDESIRMLLSESQSRIRSIALVYENLHQSGDLNLIELGPVIKGLSSSLYGLYSMSQSRIPITIDDASFGISLIEAVPCSLIIRELLSNSILHAFPGERTGNINISVRFDQITDTYCVIYQDNGVGVPEDIDLRRVSSIGMQLIFGLTSQLKGTIQIEGREGLYAVISFPSARRNKGDNL
ncbi:MAG TPA: PAS domain S-box protein [Methanospirillum sp.]|nr:PAS domain S-box protein [Methanospirillum sp.]